MKKPAIAFTLTAALGVATVVVAGTSDSETPAQASSSGPVTTVAGDDPVLHELAKQNPSLDIDGAFLVASDGDGRVWRTTSSKGEVCLVERVDNPRSKTTSRFGCIAAEEFEADGLVAGVPGAFYGLTPDTSVRPVATVGARDVELSTTTSGYFEVPEEATAVQAGGARIALPAPLPPG